MVANPVKVLYPARRRCSYADGRLNAARAAVKREMHNGPTETGLRIHRSHFPQTSNEQEEHRSFLHLINRRATLISLNGHD